METPTNIFHDTLVLSTRLQDHPAILSPNRVVSSGGVSPIRGNGQRPLANQEETSLENSRRQVLHDLMMLAGEGVDLSHDGPATGGLTSRSGHRGSRKSSRRKEKEQEQEQEQQQTNCVGTSYATKDLVGSCSYTDMDIASTDDGYPPAMSEGGGGSGGSGGTEQQEATEFGGVMYYVDQRKGTLGVLDLGRRVRRTLLHGLSNPTHVQVVGRRVYWLESGDDWSFNGRLCFLDRRTERVRFCFCFCSFFSFLSLFANLYYR